MIGHGTSIEELEEELLDRLSGPDRVELTEGGSPARLVHSGDTVMKLLVDLPGAVDGHDLASFRTKIDQITKVRAEIPELRPVYTDLSQQFHGRNWSAYTMPFYPGRDVAAPLREGRPGFDSDLRAVMGDLIRWGYLRGSAPAAPGHINEVHIDRLRRRFWLLRTYLPGRLTEAEKITINGRICRNPLDLTRVLRDLTATIDPVRLYYPVHGDLNTRNVLVSATGYRVLDPRGTLEWWDPAYDLSKILFSLTVWDAGLRRGFEIEETNGHWHVAIRGGTYPMYGRAARELLPRLRATEGFAELDDPGWDSRYLLGHAFHLLAEAACRLSDIKKRTSEQGRQALSPVELATGHYLYGALFLEDAVAQLQAQGAIDHDSTLALLDVDV